jgi:hypothetical protein
MKQTTLFSYAKPAPKSRSEIPSNVAQFLDTEAAHSGSGSAGTSGEKEEGDDSFVVPDDPNLSQGGPPSESAFVKRIREFERKCDEDADRAAAAPSGDNTDSGSPKQPDTGAQPKKSLRELLAEESKREEAAKKKAAGRPKGSKQKQDNRNKDLESDAQPKKKVPCSFCGEWALTLYCIGPTVRCAFHHSLC